MANWSPGCSVIQSRDISVSKIQRLPDGLRRNERTVGSADLVRGAQTPRGALSVGSPRGGLRAPGPVPIWQVESCNGAGRRRQGSGDTKVAAQQAVAAAAEPWRTTSQGPSCQLAGLLLGHWWANCLWPDWQAFSLMRKGEKKKFQLKTSQEPVCMQLFYIHQQLLPTILLLLNY